MLLIYLGNILFKVCFYSFYLYYYYLYLKRMAKPYQEAKNVLRAYLYQQGFGSWLEKISISDNFSM